MIKPEPKFPKGGIITNQDISDEFDATRSRIVEILSRDYDNQKKLPIKNLLDNLHKELLDKSSKSVAVKRGHLLIRKDILLNIFENWEKEHHSLDLAINGQSIETLRYAEAHEHTVKEWEKYMGKVLDADIPIAAVNAVEQLKVTIEQQKRHIARLESTLLKTLKDLEA